MRFQRCDNCGQPARDMFVDQVHICGGCVVKMVEALTQGKSHIYIGSGARASYLSRADVIEAVDCILKIKEGHWPG